MQAGEVSPDFIRNSMIGAISSYVVAFIRREGLTADEATRLLGINMEQLSDLIQAKTSLELNQMLDILAALGRHVWTYHGALPPELEEQWIAALRNEELKDMKGNGGTP